jgi:hypothetical protein
LLGLGSILQEKKRAFNKVYYNDGDLRKYHTKGRKCCQYVNQIFKCDWIEWPNHLTEFGLTGTIDLIKDGKKKYIKFMVIFLKGSIRSTTLVSSRRQSLNFANLANFTN